MQFNLILEMETHINILYLLDIQIIIIYNVCTD